MLKKIEMIGSIQLALLDRQGIYCAHTMGELCVKNKPVEIRQTNRPDYTAA